jgi:cyanate permease
MAQGSSGWTPLKVIGLAVALLGMIGFGLCSLCGFVFASSDADILWLALLGAGIAALFVWMFVAIIRAARRDREPGP